jgi:hypothetical protein
MSKSNTLENAILLLIYNGTAFADIAENDSSSPATDIYVALHTSDPGEAGNQSTNEISYTGYARIAVARSGAGWTVTNNSVSPAAAITFGAMTAGAGGTVTHFSTGVGASGATVMLHKGTVTANIVVANGVTPQLTTATAITED